jgi:esterase/lipase superfamily enzyme
VKVAFGSNRTVETGSGKFTSGTGKTRTGTCEVTVFSDALLGRQRNLARDDTPVFMNQTMLDSRAFATAMTAALDTDTSNRRAVLLYVHGFNTGFREAAQHAAQFYVDLNVPGATVLFSWPSRGNGLLSAMVGRPSTPKGGLTAIGASGDGSRPPAEAAI